MRRLYNEIFNEAKKLFLIIQLQISQTARKGKYRLHISSLRSVHIISVKYIEIPFELIVMSYQLLEYKEMLLGPKLAIVIT